MIHKLKKPIQLGELTVTELTIREEVCSGDLRGIKASALADPDVADILKIIGRLSGQPDPVVNKLSVPDLDALGAIVFGFFKSGQETGSDA